MTQDIEKIIYLVGYKTMIDMEKESETTKNKTGFYNKYWHSLSPKAVKDGIESAISENLWIASYIGISLYMKEFLESYAIKHSLKV